MNTEQRINKKFGDEVDRQFRIMVGGAALALWRNDKWRKDRLTKFLNNVAETWFSCNQSDDKTLLMMLEDETGIELKQKEDGPSYHDLPYLNGSLIGKQLPLPQFLYVRNGQMQWLGTSILASVMLTMHRCYGWGAERNAKLMNEIYDIRNEYSWGAGRITDQLYRETGINLIYTKRDKANAS